MGLKIRDFLFPLFIAISGRTVALPLCSTPWCFSDPTSRVFACASALNVLGVSKKQAKRLEKLYRQYDEAMKPLKDAQG